MFKHKWFTLFVVLLVVGMSLSSGGSPAEAQPLALATGEAQLARQNSQALPLDVNAEKIVDRSTTALDTPLHYNLAFDNYTPDDLPSVAITDTLPAGLVFTPGSLTASKGVPVFDNGVITWSGALVSGESLDITYAASVAPDVPLSTTLTNTALFDTGTEVISRTAAVTLVSLVYLPLQSKAAKLSPGFTGKVTFNGGPAGGVALELRFYDGANWSTRATTTTGADGSYAFLGVPALTAGQKYYVGYWNDTDDSRLYTWHTPVNTSYNATGIVQFQPFDIANIHLTAPDPGESVELPYTFRWNVRSATPTDSYEFNLFDLTYDEPYFFTDPPLGYTGSYELEELPDGFEDGVWYGWDMWAYGPDGGYGISYYYYYVTFEGSLNAPAQFELRSGPRPLRPGAIDPGFSAGR